MSARRRELEIVTPTKKKKKGKKKSSCRLVVFAVPADHRVKIKKSEKRNHFLDLARELKKAI